MLMSFYDYVWACARREMMDTSHLFDFSKRSCEKALNTFMSSVLNLINRETKKKFKI